MHILREIKNKKNFKVLDSYSHKTTVLFSITNCKNLDRWRRAVRSGGLLSTNRLSASTGRDLIPTREALLTRGRGKKRDLRSCS